MKRQQVSQTGVGASVPIVVNTNATPVSIGMGVSVTGTVTYSVQHTYDDPFGTISTWYTDSVLSALTANGENSCQYPVTAIRLNVTAGSGTAVLAVVQAGIA